jgi:hypothetical protein
LVPNSLKRQRNLKFAAPRLVDATGGDRAADPAAFRTAYVAEIGPLDVLTTSQIIS